MERRIAVRAIIVHEGKLLAVKLKVNEASTGDNYWCTIGGGVYSNESLLTAMKREVLEETGIAPEIGNLLYVQQFADSKKEHLEFFFHVTNGKDFLDIDLSNTTHGEIEISEIDFIDPSKEHILPEFLRSLDFSNLDNADTKIFDYL